MMLNKKLLKFIILFYILACFFALVNAFLLKHYNLGYKTYNWFELTLYLIFNYGSKFIFVLIAIIFTRKYILNRFSFTLSIIIHSIISFLLSLYSSFLLLNYENYFLGYDEPLTAKTLFTRVAYGSNFNFFIYFTLITILYAFHYFQKQKDQELKETNLKAQLLDSKIKALQSQLQPHFLFNALNDISSLMDTDVEKSQDAIADLSEMLRKTLSIKDIKFISLNEELNILNKYLKIEKIRFGDKLNFNLEVHKQLLLKKVPPLILQPIVENSIKHGFSYNHDLLTIVVKIFAYKEYLAFEITNNGKKLDQKNLVFGNGISNVLERIDTLYEGNYTFGIKNIKSDGVITTIRLPLIEES